MIKFNEKQVKEFSEYEKKTKHTKLLIRIHVMQMKACGLSNQKIQAIKSIPHDTVSRYIRLYKEGGIDKLLEWKCEWWTWKLTEEQKKIIKEKWEKVGFKTAKEVVQFIKDEFWIQYKVRQIQKLLKKWYYPTKKQQKYLENVLLKKNN